MIIVNRLRWIPLLIAALVIAGSTVALYLLIWNYGANFSWKDPRHYLGAGYNFYQGNGFVISEYDVEADAIVMRPLTHFPPFVSMVYALLMWLGVSPDNTPTLVALLAWPFFLVGIGLLTYRLSHSAVITLFSVLIAVITWPYLGIFTKAISEVIFLPLLVFLTLTLTGLSKKRQQTKVQLGVAAVILALLMLVRYVGIFFYAATLIWWSWWRIKQRQFRQLFIELIILGAAALPFLAWIAQNKLLTGNLFGPQHLGPSQHTFADGLIAVVKHSSWLILPALRPGPIWREFGWVGVSMLLILVAMGVYLFWRYRPQELWQIEIPSHTPIPIYLVMYFALFTVFQPFLLFFPMTERFMSVALCLMIPWLLSMFVRVPPRWAYTYLSGYITLNLTLLILLSFANGLPNWIIINPPRFGDLANRPTEVNESLTNGVPSWFLHRPPRLKDLPLYHQDVNDFLQIFGPEVAIVSNAPDLFTHRTVVPDDWPVSYWLDDGSCVSRNDVLIIIIDWDRWADGKLADWLEGPSARQLARQVEQKCPTVSKTTFSHSIIYHLPKQQAARLSETE